MLTELHIEDLGVISSLDLVLGPGLTALTGETGAGKTMLVEAISLLVGGRADAAMVRPGATEARVEGRFVVGDDEVVLARVVPVSGRSRAYVNGRLATVATLAEHAARLVDIHGQHEHQRLLAPSTQRESLDRFAQVDLVELRAARGRLTEIDAALAALGGDGRARAREVDLLTFQRDELVAAGLDDVDEERQLDDIEELLSGAQAHREAAAVALEALIGDGGAGDAVGSALVALGHRGPFAALVERLRSVLTDMNDIAHELRATADSIEEDPQRLAEVRARRQLLRTLRRKYGETLADVIDFRDETRRRLDELSGYEQAVARLEREREEAVELERVAAAAVGAARRAGAGTVSAAIEPVVRTLALPHATLRVVVGDDDPGDDVSFLFSANPGMTPLALQRVASGGELARVMLALRLVLRDEPSTLVFDEVDAGIGGAAALAVARALGRLGHRHQVLVVTHLAQVAATAHQHLVVEKRVVGGVTAATVTSVDGAARVAELARMLSGSADAAVAREHAAALLAELAAPEVDGVDA
jgi:DNA repair protein RecN (Recombination protein N)